MRLQRILASIVLSIFVFGHVVSLPAFAADTAPTPPPAPEAPSAPSTSTPTPPPAPTIDQKQDEPEDDEDEKEEEQQDRNRERNRDKASSTPAPSSTPQPTSKPASSPASTATPTPTSTPTSSSQPANNTGNQEAQGNNGDTNLTTGNATNGAGVMNSGNINTATQAPANGASSGVAGSGPSTGVVNSGNGSGSNNTGAAWVGTINNVNQGNSAGVVNDVRQSTTTGDNKASDNTGGNVNLTSGDANTTGTIINSLNTNVSGVAVAEFNVEDTQRGDLVLDFAAGCISNCGPGSVNLANKNNGSDSNNSANADINNVNNTNQFNEGDIVNNMTLSADSGNNEANDNTNGDVAVKSGDANVVANVLTMANNNVEGNIVYTTVNVFGDLIGDIIMSKEYIAAAGGCLECGGGDISAANTGNGTGSDNNASIDQNTANNTFQSNDANIENNLIIDAQTSNNEVNDNTNGDNNIKTGNTNVDANVVNVANSNVAGGVWWLVLVNEAGNWVGKIVGSPDGTNMAGSEGTEFVVDENGEVMAVNSGNGSDSTNNTAVAQNTTNNTVQDNKVNLVNNVDLSANTGRNEAKGNTGGNTSVETGDANVVANIVNFVNNNITGGGKLFVTVVNILPGGKWVGDFVTPDATPEQIAQAQNNNKPEVAQGKPEEVKEKATATPSPTSNPSTTTTTNKTTKKKTAVAPAANEDTHGNSSGGAVSGSTGSTGVLGAAGASLSQVAGVKIGPNLELPDGSVVANSKTKINLAWLVLALPLLGLIAFSRIRIAYYTRQIKSKLVGKKVEGVLLGSLIAACIFILNRVS